MKKGLAEYRPLRTRPVLYCIHSDRHNDSFAQCFSFLFLPQKEKKQKKSHRCIKNPCFLHFVFSRNLSRSEASFQLISLRFLYKLFFFVVTHRLLTQAFPKNLQLEKLRIFYEAEFKYKSY
jgi:hypothetical protein